MKKTRAKYCTSKDKAIRANENLERAKAAGGSYNKQQKSREKEDKKASKNDNEYRISVDTAANAQRQFYDNDMPTLLRDIESHEKNRMENLKDFLGQFVELEIKIGPGVTNCSQNVGQVVDSVDPEFDLRQFVDTIDYSQVKPEPAKYVPYGEDLPPLDTNTETKKSKKSDPPSPSTTPAPSVMGGPPNRGPPSVVGGPPSVVGGPPSGVGGPPSVMGGPPSVMGGPPSVMGGPPSVMGGPPSVVGGPPSRGPPPVMGGPPSRGPPPVMGGPPPVSGGPPPPMDLPPLPPDVSGAMGEDEYIALYDYDAEDPEEISFDANTIIVLLETDDSGWWKGRNENGQVGIFPCNYVEKYEEGEVVEINDNFTVLYDYDAEDSTEISIKQGESLYVFSEVDGWYFGKNSRGEEGNFPSNYVERQ
eukprot:TRINITY_DN369_c0_g1_i3.p1 TRINITY_DN369_c0_g1~~TRINITY_DN369_c0_g1_i3.p1  ORF type:complete len:418 (+),score=153.02 TRINITY_DN369_c0_g1_i3:551-1804(+)